MTEFAGTGALLRLQLRRDRVLVAVWIAVFVVMTYSSAAATIDLYPTVAARVAASETINRSQALVALYGRVYDPTSIGALSLIKLGGFGSVFVAMLAVVLVVRHTRADEEAGRTELLGATAVGRRAPLAASLLEVLFVNVVLAALTAVALAAPALPLAGSIAFGLAWGGVGLAFGAIAAVVAQASSSGRGATSLSAAILAFVFVLRAVGDAAGDGAARWLSWLSPIGWSQQFRPFAGNRWWVLGITLTFAAVTTWVAFALAARRDLGTGLLPTRAGPAHAGPRLGSASGLAWRLERAQLLGWSLSFLLTGALLGNLATNVSGFMTSDQAREFITKLGGEKAITDAFLATELAFAGIIGAAYGIAVVLRLRTEEVELRAEPVLAAAVGRLRWAASHLVIGVGGAVVMVVLTGLGAGLAYGVAIGDASQVPRLAGAAVGQVPATLVPIGIAIAAFGLVPRTAREIAWGTYAAFILIGELGPILELPQPIMDLSPFTHAPKLPGVPVSALPMVLLAAVGVGLGAAGLAGLRRRDVA